MSLFLILPPQRGSRKPLLGLFFVLVVALVVSGTMGFWILLTLLAVGRLFTVLQQYARPRPETPPEGWTVWPLWYVGWAMLLNRQVGQWFILGMVLNVLWGIARAQFFS